MNSLVLLVSTFPTQHRKLVILDPTQHHKLGYILSQHHKLVYFCPNTIVNTCGSRLRIIHHHEGVWKYTRFGTPIDLPNLRTNNCSNIILYNKCHNLTSKPRRFPWGTFGTEPIADSRTRTVHMEMFPLGTFGTEPVDDAITRTVQMEIL